MSVRPEAIIFDLLNQHLAGLTLSPALLVAWPLVDFTPPANGWWLEANPGRTATTERWMSNGAPAEHLGLMQVTVIAPLGAGHAPSLEVAGAVASRFAKGTRLTRGAVSLTIYDHPTVATPYRDDQSLRTPVIARWRAIY